jgi:hypothetical protein
MSAVMHRPFRDKLIVCHDDSQGTPMTKCALKLLEPEELMNQDLDVENLYVHFQSSGPG